MDLTMKDMDIMDTNQLTITGVPNHDAKRITVNVGQGADTVALHFDMRFDYLEYHRTIVLNHQTDGIYKATEQLEKHFPFNRGEEFKIIITFNKNEFCVKIPGDHIVSFPNRVGRDKFTFFNIKGDVRVKSLNID